MKKNSPDYAVTSAEAQYSQVSIELLPDNSSADVGADSAYQSEARTLELHASGDRYTVHKKGRHN